MKRKVLFVVTSHNKKGLSGPTGYHLSEVAHPWEILHGKGYDIDFVSPQGGMAPLDIDGFDLSDPVNRAFWENKTNRHKVENTMKPYEVNAADYAAIYYAGGHGAMWDLAENQVLADTASAIYEAGGLVAAVCHGVAGLINIREKTSGRYLIDGKRINAVSNEEEASMGLEKVVPFLLESKLIERGAIYEKALPWKAHVTTDRRLVTGQNPASAQAVALEMLKILDHVCVGIKQTRGF